MKAFTRTVTCVNAEGQPALREGETYEVVVEIEAGTAQRDGEDKPVKGLMVKAQGSDRAIPYVYKRDRFAAEEVVGAAE